MPLLCAIRVLINPDTPPGGKAEHAAYINTGLQPLLKGKPRSVITFSGIPTYMDFICMFINEGFHVTKKVHTTLVDYLLFSVDYDTEHTRLVDLQTKLQQILDEKTCLSCRQESVGKGMLYDALGLRVDRLDLESEKVLLQVNQAHAAVTKAEKILAHRLVIVLRSLLSEGILVQLEE